MTRISILSGASIGLIVAFTISTSAQSGDSASLFLTRSNALNSISVTNAGEAGGPSAPSNNPGSTHARSITATCYSCHGTDGKSHSAMPPLAGMDKSYFIEQMKDFKSGKREATVMHQHAKGYTDEEFQQMADIFAAIKP